MHEAGFVEVFVGIETPDADALKGMKKDQNLMVPLLELIGTLNSYGLEVTAGMIIGLDTDTPDTDAGRHRLHRQVATSRSSPSTCCRRCRRRRCGTGWRATVGWSTIRDLESNVRFLRPHDDVVASWRRCIAHAYAPERLFARYRHQVDATYPNRFHPPARGRLTLSNLRLGATLAFNVATRVGLKSDYRGEFWRAARPALKRGQIEAVLGMGFAAHHLIQFSREALRGEQNASFYSARDRQKEIAAERALADA